MTRKYYLALAVGTAAAILVSAGPLAAHECAGDQRAAAAPADYADKNRDGKVTRQEAEPHPALARNFDRYDVNDDAILDRAEFARLEAENAPARGAGTTDVAQRSLELNYDYDMHRGTESRPRDPLRPRHVVHPAPQ